MRQGCTGWSFSLPEPDRFPDSDVEKKALSVGVIGYGYWGPNIVRNFHSQDDSRFPWYATGVRTLLPRWQSLPWRGSDRDVLQILRSPKIDIVAVVTPVLDAF